MRPAAAWRYDSACPRAPSLDTLVEHRSAENLSLFQEACKYIPGGVNSPVRAFRGVGGEPIFFKKAQGAYWYAADGRRFIDLRRLLGSDDPGPRAPAGDRSRAATSPPTA